MTPLQSIRLSPACSVTLHRTLRLPDDGGEYPLAPSLGRMVAHVVDRDELVVPMRRPDALWLEFSAPWWRPHALKVGIGDIEAIFGSGLRGLADARRVTEKAEITAETR